MSCWTVLGLSADADTRTIKRHYAALLKQTRPDEDPEGFQRLREAYEHALAYKESARFREENQGDDGEWDLTDLSASEVGTLQLITRPLAGASLGELEQRYAKALEHDAVYVFEDGLLRHCVEQPDVDDAVLAWAFETFHWLSAWQRLDLNEELLVELLEQQRQRIEQPLCEALERQDVESFLQVYARYSRLPWLKSEQHRLWFNRLLSHTLLDSRYWSATIFDTLCAGQGWHSGDGNACPSGEWTRLLARRDAPAFLARQQRLLEQPATTVQRRAARLLLAPGALTQRRALARRLREDDWKQCHQLSAALDASHPQTCEAMPGGTPFFWRDWEDAFDSWPIYLGIALACLIGTFVHYAPGGTRLGGLISIAIFWSIIFAVVGALLNGLAHRLAHRLWPLEDRLGSYLSAGFNPPLFGVLRDVLPCTVMAAGIGNVYGPVASAVYALTLMGVGLLRRQQAKPQLSWREFSPALKRCLIGGGVVLLIILLGVFNVWSNASTVNRNQGLQPWAERLCSRMPASARECSAPATDEQWYGEEARP
jgi:hypothetical protein